MITQAKGKYLPNVIRTSRDIIDSLDPLEKTVAEKLIQCGDIVIVPDQEQEAQTCR